MKRFLIWGIKWTCLSLCGFALCGNMADVTVMLLHIKHLEAVQTKRDLELFF